MPALSPTALTARGYVQILRRDLVATGRTVTHRNLSIPGAVLSRAIEDLARDIGRPISELAGNFIERQAPFVPTDTTHVTIFAGGNDANVIAAGGARGPRRQRSQRLHRRAGAAMGHRSRRSGRRIRSRAPNARIVALNMHQPRGRAVLARGRPSEKSFMQRIAVGLSDRVNALTAQGVLVVDLMCDARLYQSSNYASDGFHPGDGGYRVFAELTFPALKDGANNQPNTNCAQRRLIP